MTYTYLALGDSYTIGESVPAAANFPNRTTALLRQTGIDLADPVIIATTGWTTDELAEAIRNHNLQETFSVVTLLIGVNNQYRGRPLDNYRQEFTSLLLQAIGFAGDAGRVVVLSIPDWGATPFAEGRDREQIAREIDAYNSAAEKISSDMNCAWLDITDSTRTHGQTTEYLAEDCLHPSGKEYVLWAERLVPVMKEILDGIRNQPSLANN